MSTITVTFPETTLSSSRNATAASPVATADQKKRRKVLSGAMTRISSWSKPAFSSTRMKKLTSTKILKTFWQRVFEEFEKGGNDKNRTPETCQGRWKSSAHKSRDMQRPGLYRERATKSDETDGDRPLLKDEQKFEFISDKANEVSVDGEKDVRPIGNKKAKALKRRHAEDDDLESWLVNR
ncbi:hypothetical protein BDB00DRAFT_792432 [Zychaea mexicana]|uniref:uncharacterized protein n=1 Tax=Zychaea mexicana TaxID=64656 RepID=UPI0022FE2561|nr:uncharacterized protein BDB00DRAFT_792432 [Zychaea mexicana]KAI9485041.1 hypothetical protein BDB00DRAFT_792432 [Zychaea mexicana]